MAKVYVVSRRLYKCAYHAEPFSSEIIVKVYDNINKACDYICESFKNDREYFNKRCNVEDLATYKPNLDDFINGYYVKSIVYATDTYYESITYRLSSIDVE